MKYLQQHGKLCLTLLLALTFSLIFLTDRYVLTSRFFEDNGNSFSAIPGQSARVYDALQKWVYISSAIQLLLKLGIITLILHTGLYLSDRNVALRDIFTTVVIAEYIFLIPAAIKLATFKYTFENGTLLDWHRYNLLSALSLFPEAPADWYYALQTLNLFEISYWFVLALGISKIAPQSFDRSLQTVVTFYVPALAVWVVSITFFMLVMFPATG